jgi:hypothetical protein
MIPLVNRAWAMSFGRAEFAKKAVAKWGWGPLNYVLLDSPKLISFEDTKPKAKRKLIPVDELEVNVTGELSTSYLSMILENKEKREGVKKIGRNKG